MSSARIERLVNLTLALMAAPRPMTVAEIATDVYGEDVADEAFRRKFERDKSTLREQGIPVVTEPLSVWDDVNDVGYRILRRDYALPDLVLDAEEAAALGLAARVWNGATFGPGVAQALRKLEAAGAAPVPDDPGMAIAVVVDEGDPALAPCLGAVRNRQRISFDYRGARDSAPRARLVEPYGVTSWHGRWYLVGRDVDLDEERVFRLSRIDGRIRTRGPIEAFAVPDGVSDLAGRVAAVFPDLPSGEADIRVEPDSCWTLRRGALHIEQRDDGEHVLLPMGDVDRLAEVVVGLSPQAVVTGPAQLRAAVIARLREAARAHGQMPSGETS